MKTFWQYSVAVLLGVASFTPAWSQQNIQPRGNAALRVPVAQQQAAQQVQQNPNGGVFQAQGVNRNAGQQGDGIQRGPNGNNQNRQFLGNNRQGQPVQANRFNALDEFGANAARANQVINEQNDLDRQAMGTDSFNNGSNGSGDLMSGSGGFIPSGGGGGGGYVASYEQSILNGQAAYMQSAGEYNRSSAEAIKTLQQAQALALENKRTGLKTYFELKDMNARYRSEHAPVPVSKEKLDQWNREDQPERLTKREYNSDTGRVQWPSVLMTPMFDARRIQLEELFARRTANEYGVNSDFYRMVQQDTSAMRELLKAYLQQNERFFTDQEYTAARNFLESLANEARLAPDLDGLVAN